MTFISHLHKDLRRVLHTRRGATHRPEDVPTGTHKEYPRMRAVALPEPKPPATTLGDALHNRRSARGLGRPEIPVHLQELGTLFGLSLRRRSNVPNRNYPSGGALYPIETYFISKAMESQTPAVFHYNPTKHVLERLWDLPSDFNLKSIVSQADLTLSSLIVFTSVWRRSSAKYGDITYINALLEAGHMSENMVLVGGALDLEMRPYAGFNDALIAQLLDLDEDEEQTVHTITVCKK
jgi:SagB-type dehydrogenase family enzyme